MAAYKLTDWAFAWEKRRTGYEAPEQLGMCATGLVTGHPKFENGTRITTSRIVDSDGRKMRTGSGNTYVLLGDPSEAYLEWLELHGKEMDPDNPVRWLD